MGNIFFIILRDDKESVILFLCEREQICLLLSGVLVACTQTNKVGERRSATAAHSTFQIPTFREGHSGFNPSPRKVSVTPNQIPAEKYYATNSL